MISVCIATYNGEKYIKDQLNSILPQLGDNDEVVISDDKSSDNTIKVIQELCDKRISIYIQENNTGVTGNFENALKHAKGDYIFLADQDDVWLDNKVEVMMSYLVNNPYVVSDCKVTDSSLSIISNTRYTKESGITKNKYLAFIKSTPFQGSCVAFQRVVLDKALPFPDNIQSHDRWIGFVAAFYFSIQFIPDCLILYRRHESTVSTATEGKSQNSVFSRIQNRLGYIKGLIAIRNK